MSEARKMFAMDTFVAYLKGEGKEAQQQEINNLLFHMTQHQIDQEAEPFAAALAKAWLYEQHPELTEMSKSQIAELGESVSVAPMPARAQSEVSEILEKLSAYRQTIAEQESKIAGLEEDLGSKEKKLAELEKKVAEYESEKKGEAEQLFITTEKRVEEFTEKLEALLKEVEEVKKTGVVVGVAAGAAAAGAAAEAAPASTDSGSDAGDDFGFAGGAADPFSSEDW